MLMAQQQQQNKILMALIEKKKARIFVRASDKIISFLFSIKVVKPLTRDLDHVNLGTSFWTVLQCNGFSTMNFVCVFIHIGS